MSLALYQGAVLHFTQARGEQPQLNELRTAFGKNLPPSAPVTRSSRKACALAALAAAVASQYFLTRIDAT
jgi:hypothetical protein